MSRALAPSLPGRQGCTPGCDSVMIYLDLLLLGAAAGFTIYPGLMIARIRELPAKTKGMLNAAAIGILLFLLVDVMGDAFSAAGDKVLSAIAGSSSPLSALAYVLLLAGGLSLGLLGLVWFEGRYMRGKMSETNALEGDRAKAIALMIATGIGLHNFSEGLAIGQSYAGGAVHLALLLVVGFGLHNATEGFGIGAPISGTRPDMKFLAMLGLVGGGPTFLGAIVGGFWVSPETSLLFLSLAAGAIIYVVKELLYHGRVHGEGIAVMGFLIIGFLAGFLTDLALKAAVGA